MRTDILGVAFDDYTLREAAERALTIMKEKSAAYVCTPNPEIVWNCRKNEALKAAVNRADMVLPDGVGILWAAKTLRRPLQERVAGVDFLMALLARMEGSVFLLGGAPGVAEMAAENIEKQFPKITVAGCRDGYFFDDAGIIEAVCEAEPDLLLVCLGSPKQELWMDRWAGKLPVGLMAGLGGSVDVLAGRVKRAPLWWRERKMEWLYRLIQQPSRIKRQLCLPRYVLAVMAERIQS